MKIKLIRDLLTSEKDANSIRGVLLIANQGKIEIFSVQENILYLLQSGKYILKYEFSPKFNRNLWELYGTNPRSEIKFHSGSHSKHSEGCILLRTDDIDRLHSTLNHSKIYEIEIINF